MNNHELNNNGRKLVEKELLRRSVGSVTSSGTRKKYLHVTNSSGSRTVEIKVKVKRKGNWHTTIDEATPTNTPLSMDGVTKFWVFVDLGSVPRFWIVSDPWIRNDIYEAHQQYLSKHGGHRPKNDQSNHHSIDENRIEQWQDKWEILCIF